MSKRIDVLPRLEGESLTDWTLRFLADGRQQLQNAQELRLIAESVEPHEHDCRCEDCERESYNYRRRTEEDADRRRLDDLYRACTPVEAEYSEGGEE